MIKLKPFLSFLAAASVSGKQIIINKHQAMFKIISSKLVMPTTHFLLFVQLPIPTYVVVIDLTKQELYLLSPSSRITADHLLRPSRSTCNRTCQLAKLGIMLFFPEP